MRRDAADVGAAAAAAADAVMRLSPFSHSAMYEEEGQEQEETTRMTRDVAKRTGCRRLVFWS